MATPNLSDPAIFNRQAALAAKYLKRPLKMKEIRLPAGDLGSVAIDWPNNGARMRLASAEWLSQGFDGVRLIGDGQQYMRCTSWDGNTFAVGRHAGVVQLEGVHLWAGTNTAYFIGMQNFTGRVEPKFQFRFLQSRMSATPPEEQGGVRSKFVGFGNNYDEWLADVVIDAVQAKQHGRYRHGSASRGDLWESVRCEASGECKKDRPEANETAWPGSNVWSITRNCALENWGQEWGDWTEGAGLVYQNAGCNVLVEDTLLRGRLGHLKCLHLAANANSYDIDTGRVGVGYGNGFVVVRRCGMTGAAEGFWNNSMVNVYRDAGASHMAAKGIIIEDSALYGKNSIVSANAVPSHRFLVQRCNTPEARAQATHLGIDTRVETTIPTASRLVPVSAGYFA